MHRSTEILCLHNHNKIFMCFELETLTLCGVRHCFQAGAIKHIVERLDDAKPDDYVAKTALSCLLNLCASNLTNKLEVSEVNW